MILLPLKTKCFRQDAVSTLQLDQESRVKNPRAININDGLT